MDLKKVKYHCFTLIALFGAIYLIASQLWAENLDLSINKSFREEPGFSNLLRSVVKINTWEVSHEEGIRHVDAIIGSGVIINKEGFILTNAHIINEHTEKIIVTLANLEHVKAKKIGWDRWTDLAVIQIDMEDLAKKKLTFDYAKLGESSKLQSGDFVFAVGTPHGFTRTVTHGIISNTNRYEAPKQLSPDFLSGMFNTWLQTDAAINPGNSGGPLALPNGEVVGINTWIIFQANNLGFSVPIDVAKPVIDQLIDKGQVTRSTIGLELAPLQDLENYFNLEANRGALVSNTDPGSPAALAGLRAGDVILDINNQPVDGRFPEQLPPINNLIAKLPVGTRITITYKRGHEIKTIELNTEELENRFSEEFCFEMWGLCVQSLTKSFTREHKLTVANGLRIIGLQLAFPAAEAGLKDNDVILSANRQSIHNIQDLLAVYEQYKNKPDKVLLEVNRGPSTIYVVLKPQSFSSIF